MGSAIAPETAGPMMKPSPIAEETRDIPNAWLVSSETSDITALTVPTIPDVCVCVCVCVSGGVTVCLNLPLARPTKNRSTTAIAK